jgi:hypothetical protein
MGAAEDRGREQTMIQGLITTRHVFRHSLLIISEFGLPTFLRCVRAVVGRQPTTFLALVANCSR